MELPNLDQWHRDVPRTSKHLGILGFGILLVLTAGFGTWAGYAPLEGAVVTSGTFVATGQNKQVQHFEGGIVQQVAVKEGDIVEQGQILLRLEETAARARLMRLVVRRFRLLAIRARLEAEIDGSAEIPLPPQLASSNITPEVRDVIARQEIEFEARRNKSHSEKEVLLKEIAGLRETIVGYQARVNATEERLELFREELKDKSILLARQLARKTDVLTIRRAEVGLTGELGELVGRIADAKERIARAEQQIISLQSAAAQSAVEELRKTETELDDVTEQLRAAEDVVKRVEVRSPVRGAVVKLNYNTSGGVISPGAVILELLPMDEDLLIEARISPREIAHVHHGQNAMVRLSALNQRLIPMIPGRVVYVSADSVKDGADQTAGAPRAGPSFVVRVRLDNEAAARLAPSFKPMPGMPADLFMRTKERTFFDYILRPVLDSFTRAFREA